LIDFSELLRAEGEAPTAYAGGGGDVSPFDRNIPEFNGKIVVVTGELSGEIHAARLLTALKELTPISVSGMGGSLLEGMGGEIVQHYHDISVTGLTEVLSKLPRIRKAYNTLKRHLLETRPALLILVDFPGFNLRIAAFAKKQGIPVVYFIPPQVWAWRKGRIKGMKKSIDLIISILPFEEELYKKHAMEVTYVGHPFATTVKPLSDKEEFRQSIGIADQSKMITIMPGSRKNEIIRHLPVMAQIARRLRSAFPDTTVLLPVADGIPMEMVENLLPTDSGIRPVKGVTYDALAYSDLAIIASGSATLEAALLGVPSIVIYRISWISYLIARLVVKVKFISLPNIIAGKEVFPEFIQHLSAEDVADKAIYMLNNERQRIKEDMDMIRTRLGSSDSYRLGAEKVAQFLEARYGALPKTP
jgi:lipid-A-disaccharide synthase